MEVITKMRSIARRIARLEALSPGFQPGHGRGGRWSRGQFHPPMHFRFGNLRRLPEGHQGERHVEIAKYLPAINGQEWVEFVEVPGPGPNQPPPDPWLPRCVNVVFVEPYPAQLNAP
jgi:hypothetical protein